MRRYNYLLRIILFIIVFTLGINSSYADVISVIEGESMPDAIVGAAESPYIVEPPANAIIIDFDDLIPAPNLFAHPDAKALRGRYADQGVSFDGPGPKDGGAILDESSGFFVDGHSSPNFLAFSKGAGFPGGGVASGPETMNFEPPVNHVQAKIQSFIPCFPPRCSGRKLLPYPPVQEARAPVQDACP